MDNCPDISLILPAYNEVNSIARTIGEVQQYFASRKLAYEIVVSADGNDGTRELVSELAAQEPRIQVMGQPERLGKGRGIRQAVAIATGSVIGFADADNKVPIEELDKLRPFFDEGYDIVIGSRALASSRIERKQPLYRRLGSAGFAIFLHTIIGLSNVPDTQCGFKFFKRHVAKDLFRRQKIDGYMFDVEILALAQRLSYSLKQVPIRWHDDGDSRLELLRGNIRNVRDIFRIRQAVADGMRSEVAVPEPSVDSAKAGEIN